MIRVLNIHQMAPSIELIVTLLYGGKKAQDLAADGERGVAILLQDLQHLKLPHPKRENITLICETTASFGYEFFWSSVKKFGVSDKTIFRGSNTYSSVTAAP